MSSFDLKKLQSVRVWNKNITKCQMLKLKFWTCDIVIFKFHNVSVFEIKTLQRVRYPIWNSSCCHILNFIFHNVSHLEFKFLQRIKISKYNYTTCQTLHLKNHNVMDFEMKTWQSVIF